MKDWNQILQSFYPTEVKSNLPEVGSIWAALNGIWDNSFASNKPAGDYHPSIIGKLNPCNTSCKILPGTSKNYTKGSCVFKVKINQQDSNCPLSHFLIEFMMTINLDDLFTLKQGWNGIKNLNDDQLKDFKQQIKFCKGINV